MALLRRLADFTVGVEGSMVKTMLNRIRKIRHRRSIKLSLRERVRFFVRIKGLSQSSITGASPGTALTPTSPLLPCLGNATETNLVAAKADGLDHAVCMTRSIGITLPFSMGSPTMDDSSSSPSTVFRLPFAERYGMSPCTSKGMILSSGRIQQGLCPVNQTKLYPILCLAPTDKTDGV